MRTPKQLLDAIALVAPSISLGVIWSHDNETFDGAGDWTDGERAEDWQCWQSEVVARAVVKGVLASESEYLGGTWEKFGDDPAKSNPDISGYLPQMLDDALCGLSFKEAVKGTTVAIEIEKARAILKTEMQTRYNEQMAAHA